MRTRYDILIADTLIRTEIAYEKAFALFDYNAASRRMRGGCARERASLSPARCDSLTLFGLIALRRGELRDGLVHECRESRA